MTAASKAEGARRIGIELLGIPGHGHLEGQARYAFHLIRALLRLETGHRFVLFYNSFRVRLPGDAVRAALDSDRFEWVHTHLPLTDHSLLASDLKYQVWKRLGRRLRLDLFHGTSYRGLGTASPPSVISVHDLTTWLCRLGRDPDGWLRRTRAQIQRARLVIAPSEHTRNDITKHLDVSPAKLAVTLYGHAPRTTTAATAMADGVGRAERPYLLYVGSFRPNKNVPRLIRAFGRLSARGIDIDLLLAGGQGGDADAIRRVAVAAGAGDRVRLLGYVADAELDGLRAGARALVLPSLYEGFGLTPLEAMDRDCPVVAARAASIPEVVGDAALLFDPEDEAEIAAALERIATDEELRRRLIERGRARVGELTWEATARATVAVYEQALAASDVASPR